MLDIRPTCEHCNKALSLHSLEARICTYDCTFCAACVDALLGNVCPNCDGGFVSSPIRPSKNRRNDNFLGKDPPSPKESIGRLIRSLTHSSKLRSGPYRPGSGRARKRTGQPRHQHGQHSASLLRDSTFCCPFWRPFDSGKE